VKFIHCPACGHQQEHPDTEVLTELRRIRRAIESQGEHMSEIDNKLDKLEADVTVLSADETRELADLAALKAAGQALTPEQAARFDALDAKIQADDAAINAEDPAPVDVPPAA
jgi:peptidoglycan hydrolase CwlO-like protein